MNKLAEQHEALRHYIDALLPGGDLVPEPTEESRAADKSREKRDFIFVQVRELKLALDAARVKSIMPFPSSGIDYHNGTPTRLHPVDQAMPAVPIVDLRRVIFPDGHAAREDRSPYRYLMVLQGPAIALACDDIGAVVKVSSGDIQWRETRTTRPWLAGMLREIKCAIIDVSVDESWKSSAAAH